MVRMSADERRGQLVEAAIRVMARDGVARATTRSIVAEADMPLGVFHYCFRSKQDLLGSVIETITVHSLTPVLEAAAGGVGPDLRSTVRAYLQAYLDHVKAQPAEHMMTYELTQYALREDGFEEVARRQYQHYVQTIEGFLDEVGRGMGLTWAQPVPVVARYLVTLLDGLTLNWLVLGDDATAAGVLDVAADSLVGQLVAG
jgi:AcrR family transcriptional regulator